MDRHLPLTTLIEQLGKREISSVELTEQYLSSAKNRSELGVFLSLNEEEALKAARQADQDGGPSEEMPLRGIPFAIKDIFTTSSGVTSCASQFLKDYRSPFTATSVQRLLNAGAFSLGKTNLDEFAMGSSNENSSFFPVRNPWDEKRVPGGSSGGSGAAIAARLAPVALGTDTGGSIRQPASLCGITGLKPTYGRISRYGLIAFASSLDQPGPMAVSAKDCALIGRLMAGKDENDSTSVDRPVSRWEEPLENICEGLRIGVPKEYFIDGISSAVGERVEAGIQELEKRGAQRVEISLPHTEYAVATYYVVASAEASSNLARFDGIRYGTRAQETEGLMELYTKSRSEGFGPEVKRRIMMGTYVLSSGYYDAYYLKAQKVRTLIQQDFQKAFADKCDVIACPTTPHTAFPIGEKSDDPLQMYLEDIFTIPASLAGVPAISLPCGFDENHLPIGLQLIGPAWEEHRILSVAQAFQDETDWHLQAPPHTPSKAA
ncbi:Asp-tRNA(Asn)/Glu-tRNA(Gln) amidotransferase subunit GatA [bacterium]|nr:Asp-tRNA(Asn)/Glu-tRNA(Gln) amidotransferase subunit GatA [bacterium]